MVNLKPTSVPAIGVGTEHDQYARGRSFEHVYVDRIILFAGYSADSCEL